MKMPSVGIIGAGIRGMQLSKLCAKYGSLYGVADSAADQLRKVRLAFPGVPARTSAQQLLASDIDAVAIATPAHTHVQLALEAIASGKHVFVVKPLAMSEEGAIAVATKAQRASMSVFVEHGLLYEPAVVAQRGLVESGALGDIVHIRVRHVRPERMHRWENVWWRLAPDVIAYIITLLGDPISVAASEHLRAQGAVSDFVYADLHFAGSRSAHVEVTSLDPLAGCRIDIFGTRAVASVETGDAAEARLTVHLLRRGRTSKAVRALGFEPPQQQCFPRSEPYENALFAFLSSFGDRRPVTNIVHGVATARTLAAVTRAGAHQTGEFVVPGTRQYVLPSTGLESARSAGTAEA